ncbi:MAG TPA: DNA phosphorothioation-associated putative methyltransferase [Polyangium sp.]|nr:DNA phosphorothioation-associated putative methyltransferase [Polyangium sp.]
MEIQRHKAALHRNDVSRPIRLGLDDGLVRPDTRVLDYGCGHGEDVRQLKARGIPCDGWDPVFRPEGERKPADVVNLGYVINVIESAEERSEVLRTAWGLTEGVLIVAGRLAIEAKPTVGASAFEDGYVTRLGTFQKLYQQHELRTWLEQSLGQDVVPAGPGVFYVFRDARAQQSFLAARYRRPLSAPRIRRSDALYEEHKELLRPLLEFLGARGRLPDGAELPDTPAIEAALGSVRRAFHLLRSVVGNSQWSEVERQRTQDLLVYLALSRFGKRPKWSELPRDLQLDLRAFFTSYQTACELADALLFSIGDLATLDRSARGSPIGKQTPTALYVHVSAVHLLPTELRLYEGCARGYIGSVEGATVVKLCRDEPRVSYLTYPDFDEDPHPALAAALGVPLQTFRIDNRDYTGSRNRPILHRKEEFVPADYPGREKFARLTKQEERFGLYEDTKRIGTQEGWAEALNRAGVELRGHRVVRRMK